MSYKAITRYTPAGTTPHIAAQDDAFIFDCLLGGRSGILGALTCTKVDDNTVRLSGGGASNGGYIIYIPSGETHELSISNGTQGQKRYDIVAAEFTKGGGEEADNHVFTVIEGTPSSAHPIDPQLEQSELISYGDVRRLGLFRVALNGLSIESITPLTQRVEVVPSVAVSESCSGNAATATDAAACSGNAATATTAASCSGNSATADSLSAARSIALTGDVSASGSFDGSSDLLLNADVVSVGGNRISVQATEPTAPTAGDLWFW